MAAPDPTGPIRKTLALLLALALLSPGPAFAQTVTRPVATPQAQVPAVSGASLGSLQPAGFGAALRAGFNSLVSLVLPSAAVPSIQRAPITAPSGSVAAGSALSLPASAIPGPGASAAAAPQAVSTREGLRMASDALAGDERASEAKPGLARLGNVSVGPDMGSRTGAGLAASAEAAFNHRAGLPGAAVQGARAADPTSPAVESQGRGGRGRKEDPPPAPPQYPARDILFNGRAFPSTAFRPDRPVEKLIVEAIDASRKSIHVTLYEFKSREILKALRRAKDRGVEVHIIVDQSNTFPRKRPGADYTPHRSLELQALLNEGFDIAVLRGMWRFGIMHSKVLVFDGQLAEFGSYNYTWTSEDHHYENAKFTDDARHVKAFLDFWQYMRGFAVPFDQARAYPWPKQLPPPPADEAPSVEHNGTRFPTWIFSPGGGGEDWIVKAIESAEESVVVSVFTYRSTRIAQALLEAKKRGVKVRVIFDRSQSEGDHMKVYLDWLAFHKIKIRTLAGPDPEGPEYAQKDHNKMMVVDGRLVETGSMNWTKNGALMSFENAHFTTDKTDAKAFTEFFEEMWKAATPAEAPEAEPRLPTDEELARELLTEPEPPPPLPVWPDLPAAADVRFQGEVFPAYAMRPQHPIKDLLIKAIDVSKESILLSLYEFNLPEILESLKRAKARGVKVRIVVDYLHMFPKGKDHTGRDRERSEQIQALIDEGFDIRALRGVTSSGTNHNKFALFDGKMAEFGSYNWARTAEENHFENALFTVEPARARFYARYWDYLYDLAVEPKKAEDHDWAANKPGAPPRDEDWSIELNGARFPATAGSPAGGIEAALLLAIQAAAKTIDVAMFSFYSRAVAEALLAAKSRGVAVRLVLDENQSKLMKLDQWFAYHNFDVRIIAGPDDDGNVYFEKMHHKFMRIDGKFLETGSYNYTGAAENSNFENANFITDPGIVDAFGAAFEMLFGAGWKPRKPAKPPELNSAPADFFSDAFPES